MKKLIAAALALTTFASSSAVFANGEYNEEYKPELSLIYNNREVGEEGSIPFIHEDRTMLPFRYLLDNIGASVDYDESTRMVSAEKDGIAIAFSLDDTYIDITSDGETERVVQDVANVIKDDRVYVPIRFMSEAFDLSVGWDDYNKTAIIVDFDEYTRELEEKVPELKQYFELCTNMPESYTQTLEMTFNLNYSEGQDNIKLDFALDSELSLNGGAVYADASADLDTNLVELLSGISFPAMKDVQFTFMYNDGQFYAKTNLIDKLKEAVPGNEFLNSVSFVADANTWFKADIYQLFDVLGLPAEMIDVVKSSLGGTNGEDALANTFKASFSTSSLSSTYQAQSIDMAFDVYSMLFADIITITDNGDGNYDIKIAMDKDKLIETVKSTSPEISDDEINEIFGSMIFDVQSNIKLENNVVTVCDSMFDFSMDLYEASMSMKVNSAFTPDTNKEITTPETALDLINIIKLFKTE